jgi:cysteine desulfurase
MSFSELGCDHLVLSGAKLYGLPRTAAVVSRRALHDAAKARFGSPDAPGAEALGVACRLRSEEMTSDEAGIAVLRNRLQAKLKEAFPEIVINGDENCRLAGTLSFAVPDCPNDAVLDRLYGRLALSTGAACRSGAIAPSHVLVAMGAADWVLDGVLRASVGKFNTLAEIDLAAKLIADAITAVRSARQRRIA